ncbi:RNA polymerase II transcription elongation factor-domain-containing protein [Camillea tinctor]|nr:RNA polymerase II transcription elongation factor-domain-containing protein [Camillea tinctor]
MASLAAGIVDPTKAGKYPVVLSDALLGKDPKEIFTGIRYNHKPTLSSSTAPHQARIKTTSASSKKGAQPSYDLSFQDDGGRYDYKGTRGNEDKQYVLIFDPERQVFVLHKVDSMFNMNLVRTPSNTDAESLRQEYTQLESHKDNGTATTNKKTAAKDSGASGAKSRKPAPKDTKKSGGLSMPEKKTTAPLKPSPLPKSKPNARKPVMDIDSEDESSDDDLLTIEDPGGAAPGANRDFSPGFMDKPRPFSEFVQQQEEEEEEEEDADGEDEDDDDAFEHFKLPSPINRQGAATTNQSINHLGNGMQSMQFEDADDDDEEEEDDEEMEDVGAMAGVAEPTGEEDVDSDLEAALLAELGEGQPNAADKEESDVSEEE